MKKITYDNEITVEFDENSFYISPNSDGLAICGHKTSCPKCKRKILLQMPLFGVPHHFDAFAVCAECFECDADFAKEFPELAADLEKWKK